MSLKTWLMSLVVTVSGHAVAQDSLSSQPSPDKKLSPIEQMPVTPPSASPTNVAPWNLEQKADTAEVQQKPAVDISKVAKAEQKWAKSTEGQEVINAYRDAVESLLPNKKITEVNTEDIFFLRLLNEQTDSCIGSYPNSTLKYGPRDLLEMDTGEHGAELADIVYKNKKPRNNGRYQCARAVKNGEGQTGRMTEEMKKADSAYDLMLAYKSSPNHSVREIENGWEDTKFFPRGVTGTCEKGIPGRPKSDWTRDAHTWAAGDGDNLNTIVIDGKKYTYYESIQLCDNIYGFNPTGSRASGRQHYGKPYMNAGNDAKIGIYTRFRELGNPIVEEYRNFTPLTQGTDVSELVNISPKKMYEQFTKNKQILLAKFNCDNNGKPQLITEMPKINWLRAQGGWGGGKSKKGVRRAKTVRHGGNRRI